MKISNPKKVLMRSLEDSCGLTAYMKTLDYENIKISQDVNYQKNFNYYYRVRRDENWLNKFYEFFEEKKTSKNISFEEILRHLSSIEHKVKITKNNPKGLTTTVEASFASKMLATINPDFPIWDSQVLNALGKKTSYKLKGEDKIKESVQIYDEIKKEIDDFIKTKEGQECIALFDKTFPNHKNVSAYKKIDFYLWNIGK